MKRVIVIGSPGAGKSVFSRRLAEATALPLVHLDRIWHRPDKTTVTREEFRTTLEEILRREAWIIDGNYSRTLDLRLASCDKIFFFDLPAEDCLAGAQARVGTVHDDLPWVEESLDPEFAAYIRAFPTESAPAIRAKLHAHLDKSVHFPSREASERYLARMASPAMRHAGTAEIKTPRLLLRRFRAEDAEASYRNWAGDPRVTEHLRWQTHADPAATKEVLAAWSARYRDARFYQWAIAEHGREGEPVGTISAVRVDDEGRCIHIGYCLGSAFWGRGYMTEALACVIRFFRDTVGAQRIESWHAPENPASGRVMQKCGMRREALLKGADYNRRGTADACLYALEF